MIRDLGTKIAESIDKFYKAFQKQRVLKTMEEVVANTNETNLVSAPVVAELKNKLSGFEPICDASGKITGYKTAGGADTVFPFSDIKYKRGTFTISLTTAYTLVDVGFRPKFIYARLTSYPGNQSYWIYDEQKKSLRIFSLYPGQNIYDRYDFPDTLENCLRDITDNGFLVNKTSEGNALGWEYIAIG